MTKVNPFVRCVDYWPIRIPSECLDAYAVMVREGQIVNQHVIHNGRTGTTLVEYDANQPHEWVRQELAKRARRVS